MNLPNKDYRLIVYSLHGARAFSMSGPDGADNFVVGQRITWKGFVRPDGTGCEIIPTFDVVRVTCGVARGGIIADVVEGIATDIMI